MTQIIEVADLESISLGRRLREILLDKGKAFSLRAMQIRTGITKDTLIRIMSGERYIKPTEIEVVAKALDLSVDRFKGYDVKQKMEEISLLVLKRVNLKRALQLAQEVAPISVGCTERFAALNNLGAVHFLLKNYDNAQDAYVKSLNEARKIKDAFGETSPLYKATTNLITTYIQLKDYPTATNLLKQIQDDLVDFKPLWSGNLTYSEAMIAHSMGNLDLCRAKMYSHLQYYEQVGFPLQLGIGNQNVGYVEFLLGNYEAAKVYFENAIEYKKLAGVIESRFVSIKDYAKCLLKLDERDNALRIVEEALQELKQLELPVLQAKFLLLRSVINGNIRDASEVLAMEQQVTDQLKLLACDLLMKHFAKYDEPLNLMKYYKVAEDLKKSTQIDWEGI